MKHNTFLNLADYISNKTGQPEKTGLIFTGLMYIFIAVVVFFYPQTLKYWISVIFFIQGIEYIVIFLTYKGANDNEKK